MYAKAQELYKVSLRVIYACVEHGFFSFFFICELLLHIHNYNMNERTNNGNSIGKSPNYNPKALDLTIKKLQPAVVVG